MSSRYNSQMHQRDRTQLFATTPTPGFDSSRTGTPTDSFTSPAGFRSATPNSKGQYSDQALSDMESQNDEQLEGLSARVRMLKEVSIQIGDEVRNSSKFLADLEENFEKAGVRLKNTVGRMMVMAERTGLGWRVWLGFFVFVFFLFFLVWLR